MNELPKKRRQYPEHELQVACLKWFKMQYQQYSGLIFHIPNERKQSPIAGLRAKQLGTLAGVADVFLSVAKGDYHGFYFEFKSKKGAFTPNQIEFAQAVLSQGFEYELIRDFEIFKQLVINYLR